MIISPTVIIRVRPKDMSANSPSVTVLILNWNGRQLLSRSLAALLDLDYPAYRVVVADNGSTDDSTAYVRDAFPAVSVIELGQNLGFARGNNAALALLEQNSDILVLLNNDVYVRRDWLAELVTPFADPSVGISGGKLLYPDGERIQHAGGELDYPLAYSRHYAYREVDRGQVDKRREVPYVTAAAMAIRWPVAEELGLFDQDFSPYYFEEVDLCYRAAAAGFQVVYVPEAVAIHHESFSTKKRERELGYAFHRNRLRLVFKHYSAEQILNDFIPAELDRLSSTPASSEDLEIIRRVYLETMLDLSGREGRRQGLPALKAGLGQLWEASFRVDPVHVPGPIYGKPLLDPLFRALLKVWHTLAAKVLFWPVIRRQRETNALLWRIVAEWSVESTRPVDEAALSRRIDELFQELNQRSRLF